MTIETTSKGKAIVIKLGGRLDAESTPQFNAACESLIRSGALHMVLDLAALDYISSAGLGSILRLAKKLEELGGAALLCGLRGLVREVFEVTNLLSLFKVFDSPEDACGTF
jgi:anti-anti-sigma factor